MQQKPVKVQVLALQLQLRPNTPAGEADDDRLWIVLDTAHYAVLDLFNFCWVSPHCQLLTVERNIEMVYLLLYYYCHVMFFVDNVVLCYLFLVWFESHGWGVQQICGGLCVLLETELDLSFQA